MFSPSRPRCRTRLLINGGKRNTASRMTPLRAPPIGCAPGSSADVCPCSAGPDWRCSGVHRGDLVLDLHDRGMVGDAWHLRSCSGSFLNLSIAGKSDFQTHALGSYLGHLAVEILELGGDDVLPLVEGSGRSFLLRYFCRAFSEAVNFFFKRSASSRRKSYADRAEPACFSMDWRIYSLPMESASILRHLRIGVDDGNVDESGAAPDRRVDHLGKGTRQRFQTVRLATFRRAAKTRDWWPVRLLAPRAPSK